jgi:hypothetical protein
MELYLGNNSLKNIKEIKNIKELNKLIILCISGNALTKDPNYRTYVIFNFNKLKVLDGVPIEHQEQQISKEMFVGRLTEELLNKRLNGQAINTVKELDLSNCKLKDFDNIFSTQNFPKLEELNIDNNLFTSLKILSRMPTLKILSIRSNRIETLLTCKTISQQKKASTGLNAVPVRLSLLTFSPFNIWISPKIK